MRLLQAAPGDSGGQAHLRGTGRGYRSLPPRADGVAEILRATGPQESRLQRVTQVGHMGTPVVVSARRDGHGFAGGVDGFIEVLRASPEPEQHPQIVQLPGPLRMTGRRCLQGRASSLNHVG